MNREFRNKNHIHKALSSKQQKHKNLQISTLQMLNYVNIFFLQINITKFKMSIMAHHFKYFIYEKRQIN